jgi:hypothetical protein
MKSNLLFVEKSPFNGGQNLMVASSSFFYLQESEKEHLWKSRYRWFPLLLKWFLKYVVRKIKTKKFQLEFKRFP